MWRTPARSQRRSQYRLRFRGSIGLPKLVVKTRQVDGQLGCLQVDAGPGDAEHFALAATEHEDQDVRSMERVLAGV